MARVLVVDDEPDVLIEVRSALGGAGHEVVLASDGRMAMERLASEPDVVVLDLLMPVADGYAVLDHLAGQGTPPPVIALTAGSGPPDAGRRALQGGAVVVVAKPVDGPALADLVDAVLAMGPAERDARRQAELVAPPPEP